MKGVHSEKAKQAKGPPVMALPRALLQALEQARGVHEAPARKAAGQRSSTPQRKDPIPRQNHRPADVPGPGARLSFKPPPMLPSRIGGG